MSGETIDAFHFGRFHVVQPAERGHRSGMDAMLLASMVAASTAIKVADLGAGAGAAGLAVASRLEKAEVLLAERAPEMVEFARKTLNLPENAYMSSRISVIEADVSLIGKARVSAGLEDEVFDHVIMNPPFNASADRKTPDALKADAHALTDGLFENWIRTAGAIMKPGGQLSLIARPESIAEIIAACGKRFGGLEVTLIHPREGESAVRMLVSAIKGSRARLIFRSPFFMHGSEGHKFTPFVDDLNNGRKAYARLTKTRAY